MGLERRDRVRRSYVRNNWKQGTSMRTTGKPFSIDKKLVYEAYKAVKSNAGSAGVDAQTPSPYTGTSFFLIVLLAPC